MYQLTWLFSAVIILLSQFASFGFLTFDKVLNLCKQAFILSEADTLRNLEVIFEYLITF